MKIIRIVLLVEAVLLLSIDAVLAVRTARLAAPAAPSKRLANVSKLAAEHAIDAGLTADGPAIVMEVAVPVVVVVVGNAEAGAKAAASSDAPNISAPCQQELLAVKMNKTRIAEAEECERNSDHTQHAVTALQQAEVPAALTAIEGAYHKCLGLTKACAGEVAPQLVLKLRLSGMTITEECNNLANEARPNASAATEACQGNMTDHMVQELHQEDIDGMMLAAQHGLSTCHHIEHPCDFQLAPILVMRLIQMTMGQQEEHISEVLLAGLKQAQDLEARMMLVSQPSAKEDVSKANPLNKEAKHEAPKPVQRMPRTVSKQDDYAGAKVAHMEPRLSDKSAKKDELLAAMSKSAQLTQKKQKKGALSLLSLDDCLRIVFERRDVALR